MRESIFTPGIRPPRFYAVRATCPTHIRQIEAEQAAYSILEREQRQEPWFRRMVRLWPFAVGVLLGLATPELYALVVRFEPWGVLLIFPFALLAQRPELAAVGQIMRSLPIPILSLQFPIEGLIACMALRRRAKASRAAGQVVYLQYLAALQLLLLGAAVAQALA
ncbi:MAG: hypothetical protein WBX18_04910, partial [Terracidiphilus sp.]